MKKIFLILSFVAGVTGKGFSQGFDKAISTAQSSYEAGKLEEAHFALQQAMQEVDIIIGKEVLKLLPTKMEDRNVDSKRDNVSSNIGFIGATIHRTYGDSTKKAELDIISNSPMIAALNSILNMPLIGGMMSDPNNKTVKVQGYKARLSASDLSDNKKRYELQLPLGSALITFTANDVTESQMLSMANSLPMKDIAKLIQ
ncbi:MAG: hypothetical protein MUE71_08540 [Chitinophagaceae bacterium]|jgi:hypothetical protein|nr:hypothetical protein [Chitinophagaceae bacterium]MCU0403212.1 hypothetical protein [Chitinophagaceae bacterium]